MQQINLLLVEENDEYADILSGHLLKAHNFDFMMERVCSLGEALEKISLNNYDAVLVDLTLPDSSGIATFTRTLDHMAARAKDIPIIVLSGSEDVSVALAAVQKGAQDYLVKGKADGNVFVRSIRYAIERHKLVSELKSSNEKQLEHQNSLVEEERLKALLQMAGAMAHELNQPLMTLMGSIELLEMTKDHPEMLEKHTVRIMDAGKRISNIVTKIQTIRNTETKKYPGKEAIIDLNQSMSILGIIESDKTFNMFNDGLKYHSNISISRASDAAEAKLIISGFKYDVIIVEETIANTAGATSTGQENIDDNIHNLLFGKDQDENSTPGVNKNQNTTQDQEKIINNIPPVLVLTQKKQDNLQDKTKGNSTLCVDEISETSILKAIAGIMEKLRVKKDIKDIKDIMAGFSYNDELTGVYGRNYFFEALEREISRAERYGTEIAVCIAHGDNINSINGQHVVSIT